MNVLTVSWLVFLAQIKYFSCDASNPFILKEEHLTAVEGSCVEIKCEPGRHVSGLDGDYWFWMKDATWNDSKTDFYGSVIYSSDESKRPVDPLFKNRVHYIDSSPPSLSRSFQPEKLCKILICDLNKADSGNYMFRFDGGNEKWRTDPDTNLTVEENPCPISFEGPQVVKENEVVTLKCSTLNSCDSNLQIVSLKQRISTQLLSSSKTETESSKIITRNFNVSWKDDGIEFSCQTEKNEDKYLIRNISLTVEYAPKEVKAEKSSENVIEGNSVTLTCFASGRPSVTFTWFKDGGKKNLEDKLTFKSIKASDSGSYFCKAENKLGSEYSTTVNIDVLYAPEVEVKVKESRPGGSHNNIQEGNKITLECSVKRSNPPPKIFTWIKNWKNIGTMQTHVFDGIRANDTGSYTCTAKNQASVGTSKPYHLQVHYRPRITKINFENNSVKIDSRLELTCNTDAYPEPLHISWYHDKQIDSPHQVALKQKGKTVSLTRVQRRDEGCYKCNATNSIGPGDTSPPVCIQVLFPPTKVNISMPAKVREGQLVKVTCTAESFPLSSFSLNHSSASQASSLLQPAPPDAKGQSIFIFKFNVTVAHQGVYFCTATNSEGKEKSREWNLEVEYIPKNVRVITSPSIVEENKPFSLNCSVQSNPSVTLFTWIKTSDNEESTVSSQMTYSVESAGPSDSGLYKCTAANKIGTGKSKQVELKVLYAPKHTTIIKGEEQLHNGKRSVTLTCSSLCYPPATYKWYNKTEDGKVFIREQQDLAVNSDQAGEYYCTAINYYGVSSSEPVRVFHDPIMKMLKFFFLFCVLVIVILLIFFVRRWRNKSPQGVIANTWTCWGFLGWRNRDRRGNMARKAGLTEPYRSRDDQRSQPRPDVVSKTAATLTILSPTKECGGCWWSASNINTVYSTVGLPNLNRAPAAQKPAGQRRGYSENISPDYASLDFGNKQKKPEEDAVYSKVCRPKAVKEARNILKHVKNQGSSGDYENIGDVHANKPSNLYDYDLDTSEDEVEVNYTQVDFKPKPGHQRAKRDFRSSEDMTEYSEIKI